MSHCGAFALLSKRFRTQQKPAVDGCVWLGLCVSLRWCFLIINPSTLVWVSSWSHWAVYSLVIVLHGDRPFGSHADRRHSPTSFSFHFLHPHNACLQRPDSDLKCPNVPGSMLRGDVCICVVYYSRGLFIGKYQPYFSEVCPPPNKAPSCRLPAVYRRAAVL